MPAMSQKRQNTIFSTIKSEGSVLPMDLLRRVSDPQNAQLSGLTPDDYYLTAMKLSEAINKAWTELLGVWQNFQSKRKNLPANNPGTETTYRYWLLPLFEFLKYGRLQARPPLMVGERSYAISHGWEHMPIHLVSFRIDLDKSVTSEKGERRQSPHSLLQELLNRSPEHLWGIVSNGLTLRILRNNVSLTRQAYVEFDLEEMFEHEVYADFVLFWLLCHESRFEKSEKAPQGWLENWSKEAHQNGIQALEHLRDNVTSAIKELGSSFIAHPANGQLRQRLGDGTLSALAYYNQLLRLVYRLLVLFVAEDRDILHDPAAPPSAKKLYQDYYSTARLRALADRTLGTRHADLYYGLQLIMERLGQEDGCPELGLPALNGKLFHSEAMADLNNCQLANYALLAAVRHLGYIESGRVRRVIDYKNLGSEELGSVYESLLELHPVFHLDTGTFELSTAAGNARKTTGSYYTPTSLITCLLDSTLDPVLEEAASQPDAEAAILNLKVCDPACGSGHFLVAAAHRIAKRLAAVRTGDEEPALEAHRHALRDVVGRCIYGVDINPMAVELCKVSLWMEAIDPGKPLNFLDAHIQQGNSLLGTTPRLLKDGIPNEAFEPIEGDDKKICGEFRKLNKQQREGNVSLFREDQDLPIWEQQGTLVHSMLQLDAMGDESVADVHRKEAFFKDLRQSGPYANALLWANAWCAAFVWKKTAEMRPAITDEEFRDIGRNPFTLAPWRKAEIERLARQYQFFHWHLAFPDVFRVPSKDEEAENEQAGWSGGFDVVLGNPPWEHTELKEQEWFATRHPEIANAAGAERKRKIEALAALDPKLHGAFLDAKRQQNGWSHFVRNSERYPLCGRGRINTYAIFAEGMRTVLSTQGRVGCIVPSGIATDDTTKSFFSDLTESRSLASLYSFENEEFVFPAVHHSTRFCLLTIVGIKQKYSQADFTFFARQVRDLQEEWRRFSLSADDIALFNPNTKTCPIFSSKKDNELSRSIYQKIPVLFTDNIEARKNNWGITLRQGIFNMTSDSHLFYTRSQLEDDGFVLRRNIFYKDKMKYLPLYEAKMITLFDHRFGTYEEQTQAQANQGKLPELSDKQHADAWKLPLPHYWVSEADFLAALQGQYTAFLGFRDVARAKDARTSVFCILPAVPCNHKLPLITLDAKQPYDLLYLQSCFASFVFDYATRQKLGGASLGFFILKQLPVLPADHYTQLCLWNPTQTLGNWIFPRALELTYTAWDLEVFAKDCGYDGPPFRWNEERRFLLRCELDAAYFHLYGIASDDVDYIMDTFRVWREKEEKQYGEYRTKRVILEIYDEMQRAMETRVAYETRLVPGPADPTVAHPVR